jgi:hypothetical protein
MAGFKGIVRHPVTFRADLENIMAKTAPKEGQPGKVVIVGGGKSAQEYGFFCLLFFFSYLMHTTVMLHICAMKGEMSLWCSSTRMRLWLPANALFQPTYEGVGEYQVQSAIFLFRRTHQPRFLSTISPYIDLKSPLECVSKNLTCIETNHSATDGSSTRHGLDHSSPNVSGQDCARTRFVSHFSFCAVSYTPLVQYL